MMASRMQVAADDKPASWSAVVAMSLYVFVLITSDLPEVA
jgi:hypothetical protein